MILDPAIAVAPDLYVFRCMVNIFFDEPKVEGDDAIESFGLLYGITARSYSEAVALLEKLNGRGIDADGEPEGKLDGWLEEIEVAVMDPDDVSREAVKRSDLERPGVHYVSEPIFFDDEGEQLGSDED